LEGILTGNEWAKAENRWIWIPARQMQNYKLLSMARKIYTAIILKRGFGNTIDEVIGASEYLKRDKEFFYICERGIVTFDRREDSRWMPDFRGMLELKQLGYKVIFDPSHACGKREWVIPMAKAAMALGIDGLMVEVRENPEESWSDARQCLSLEDFEILMKEVKG
jgi:3-deoxy-7-phosphoheptulonate synthase